MVLGVSNRPLEDWGKLIGDVPSASAILDRFLQSAEIMKITGRSYRLKNAEKSSKGTRSRQVVPFQAPRDRRRKVLQIRLPTWVSASRLAVRYSCRKCGGCVVLAADG
ncbi:ATP-binding protein [Aporhodopirellula aestuarii]|uniref:ATP-binding protein n=1 Tax=Aporhodopirellula aestuarii TaxID=2950107 RepID=A0ABT0U4N6_9BACT|nr:ATP-binding protein [Aporhodopirellula aestuarii]MCM2371899.1 ATP-binding protein [Aporhodopirellula aestuarii]